MKGDPRRAARLLTLPTLALVAVVTFAPGRVELALRVYALLVCATALTLLLAALRRAYPRTSRPPRRRRKHTSTRRVPGTLTRLEQEAALGLASSFDLHHRLRPRVRTLAAELLAARRGIALDNAPERSREALGDTAWELVRPDRPRPVDRQARGMPISDLRTVVESLERL